MAEETIAVTDTIVLRYLILLGRTNILEYFFERVVIPGAVIRALRHPKSQPELREWSLSPPKWADIRAPRKPEPANLARRGPGERAAIRLMLLLNADVFVTDDRAAKKAAMRCGIAERQNTGLIGLGSAYAWEGQMEFRDFINYLKQTNFRFPEKIVETFLAQHEQSPACEDRGAHALWRSGGS